MKAQHGKTPAAWTGVTVMIAGAVVCGVALIVAQPWLFAVGGVVIVLGAVAGKVMAAMGLGLPPGYHQARDRETLDEWMAEHRGAGHRSGT